MKTTLKIVIVSAALVSSALAGKAQSSPSAASSKQEFRLSAGPEAGASFLANKSDLGADKSAAFVYAPQVGVLLKLADKNYIDLGVRFESTAAFYKGGSTNNFLGLRAAYSFGL